MAVTMADVARLAGVSKATVSRALAHSPLVSEATRERVLDVVARSGYRINRNAQRLRERRTNAIAVVTELITAPAHLNAAPSVSYTLLSDTVRALAMREQAVLLLPADAASLPKCQGLLAEKSVDGFVFLKSRDKVLLNRLHALKIPFVAWDDDQGQESYCAVTGAAGRAGRLAGRHLADLGCTSILFIHATQDTLAAARLTGLSAGLKSRGCKETLQNLAVEDSSPFGVCTVVREQRKTLAAVDAIVASGESCTLGVAWAGDLSGPPFGNRVAVVGFGTVGLSERMPARVVAVEQGVAEAGGLLVEKLMARLEGISPVRTALPVYLRRGAMN
ncbi:MAG: LacI family DNA-binding transcriptional regulator [Gammaproteobacteria bacterium]|nr:LacI family DNA-binding transcriptional regulator [Gammaproteobacteria bacterium]MDE0366814.1 LacI family DNA-binding transcriptional regulator [Gammaproteobacteria bacterium]